MNNFLGYAVVDIETNGLDPERNRILEIASVGLRPDLSVEGTWSTLINPETPCMGRTDIHGLRTEDVIMAPTFADIAGDLIAALRGRILVAHHVDFDAGFLSEEFERAGHLISFPTIPAIDTLDLARQRWPYLGASLRSCCQRVGILTSAEHSALGDAWSTALLLQHLLAHIIPSTRAELDLASRKATLVKWPVVPCDIVPPVLRKAFP